MNIWQYFTRQARKEHSAGARFAVTACGGLIMVFGFPTLLFWLSAVGGPRWRFASSQALSAFCVVPAAAGLFLSLWTAWVQFRHARGTPFPVMATKKLLTEKPYSLCRNPMAFGVIVYVSGIAVFTSSFLAVLAVFAIAFFLIAYIKLIEENEMSLRFGEEYLRYKQSTPFIIPRLSSLKRKSGT